MKITIYKDLFIERIQQLDFLPEAERSATITQLTALEKSAANLDVEPSSAVTKPLKREKEQAGLSLLMNGSIPSIKLGKLGSGNSARRVYLRVDGASDSVTEVQPHYYATKVYRLALYPETSEANKAKNRAALEDFEYEVEMLKLHGDYVRHGVREVGTLVDPKTGETLRLQKIYLDSRFIQGKTLFACLKAAETEYKKLTEQVSLLFMTKLLKALSQTHQHRFAHGDLHVENVMVTGDFFGESDIKIIDFNYARPFGKKIPIAPIDIPTPEKPCKYPQIPPECCGKSMVEFTTASDIYAIGYMFRKITGWTKGSQKFKDSLKCMYTEMRHDNPAKRPTLQHLQQEVRSLLTNPNHVYQRYAISDETQKKVIEALQQYQMQGVQSWRAALTDPLFRQKSAYIADLVVKLRALTLNESFQTTFKEGFLEYIRRFIVPNLKDYRQHLGRAVECFVLAITACGEEMNKTELMEGVKQSLPKSHPASPAFERNLSNQLTPPPGHQAQPPRTLSIYA